MPTNLPQGRLREWKGTLAVLAVITAALVAIGHLAETLKAVLTPPSSEQPASSAPPKIIVQPSQTVNVYPPPPMGEPSVSAINAKPDVPMPSPSATLPASAPRLHIDEAAAEGFVLVGQGRVTRPCGSVGVDPCD